jgi:hypothetical protein
MVGPFTLTGNLQGGVLQDIPQTNMTVFGGLRAAPPVFDHAGITAPAPGRASGRRRAGRRGPCCPASRCLIAIRACQAPQGKPNTAGTSNRPNADDAQQGPKKRHAWPVSGAYGSAGWTLCATAASRALRYLRSPIQPARLGRRVPAAAEWTQNEGPRTAFSGSGARAGRIGGAGPPTQQPARPATESTVWSSTGQHCDRPVLDTFDWRA